jgi:hypothetical protein
VVSGTRGGVGRVAAMVFALTVLLFLCLAGDARAGVYEVAQCGWGIGAELDESVPSTEGAGFSLSPGGCLAPAGSGPVGMEFEGAVAGDGVLGLARARWLAPPGTSFTSAHVTWFGNPQSGNWQGLGVDVDGRFHVLAFSFGSTPPARLDLPIEGPAWAFEAWLQCLLDRPIACTRSVPSTMHLNNVIFGLNDPIVPTVQIGGALAGQGWRRAAASLSLEAADAGSGVASGQATLDGRAILTLATTCAVRTVEGAVRGIRMQPCLPSATATDAIDTARLADGPHTLRACASDFAGGQGCAPESTIQVDNSPPVLSFVGAAEGRVAVAVKDRYSGPAAGTISVRRDGTEAWTDLVTIFDGGDNGTATLTARLPDLGAGAYRLRAVATDVAGNGALLEERVSGAADSSGVGSAGHRPAKPGASSATGSPPVRGRATRLVAHLGATRSNLTVDYGDAVEVRGRLSEVNGTGIATTRILAVVRAAGRPPQRRRVLTDASGHFELRLPPGTSRRVTVAFPGGDGFAPSRSGPLALRVRAAVVLAARPADLHTGDAVRLSGRVRLGPATLGRAGRPISIQYLERATGRWRPALTVRSDAKGHFATSYRFRYVTGVARIRLRATASAERGWPFARGSSPPVTVVVRGH